MNRLLTDLNDKQQEAVMHFGSPLMIIAGAGSGKTTVLTRKMAYLVEEFGVYPDHILGITFTNKAAKEMRDRVQALLPADSKQPFLGTFHSFCADVLRRDYDRLGRSRSFTICDQSDQTRLVKGVLKTLNMSEHHYAPASLLYQIQDFKNRLLTPEAAQRAGLSYDPKVFQVYAEYDRLLRLHDWLDFQDLISETIRLFQTVPDVLESYQDYYNFILVDEYQDTNHTQYVLVNLLASRYQNLTVVGDFDQNIYSWRGANIQNMLNFERDYPSAQVLLLEQNYRSSHYILEASNVLISHNTQRREKTLWTNKTEGDKLQLIVTQDERAEAKWILTKILELKTKESRSFQNSVILYRTNAQSRIIEEACVSAGVAYRVVGGVKFFSRSDVKDILSYVRFIHNSSDSMSFSRIINVPPRGIGDVTVGKLLEYANSQQIALPEMFEQGLFPPGIRAIDKLHEFWRVVTELRGVFESRTQDKVAGLIEAVIEKTGYKSMLGQDIQKGQDRLEVLAELLTFAREEEMELAAFLDKVALVTDMDENNDMDAVTLMTVHTAKGLEYDVVFLPGMEEGVLPHHKSRLDPSELEEERRLCYVALTRARHKVYLLRATQRMIFGEFWKNEPSRFLTEIPSDAIEEVVTKSSIYTSVGSSPFGSKQSSAPIVLGTYISGDHVRHSQWGVGVVNHIEGAGDSCVLTVVFGVGSKKLLAKYAPLEKVLS